MDRQERAHGIFLQSAAFQCCTVGPLVFALFLTTAATSLCVSASAEPFSATSWNPWSAAVLPQPTRLASAAALGRFVLVAGGFRTKLGAPHKAATTDLAFIDVARVTTGVPLALETVVNTTTSGAENTTTTTNTTRVTHATLRFPVAGPNTLTTCGGEVFAIGMCNVVPRGFENDIVTPSGEVPKGYNIIQRLRLVRPPANITQFSSSYNLTMPDGQQVPLGEFYSTYDTPLLNITTATTGAPRFNASCFCHGNSIYIAGGVFLPTLVTTNQVARYDVKTGNLAQLFEWYERIVNPAITGDDSTLYLLGGDNPEKGVTRAFSFFDLSRGSYAPTVSGYAETLTAHMPRAAAVNGTLLLSGNDFSLLIAHSLWDPHAPWPALVMSHSIGVSQTAFYAMPRGANVTMLLIGGFEPDSDTVSNTVYEAKFMLPQPLAVLTGVLYCEAPHVSTCISRAPAPTNVAEPPHGPSYITGDEHTVSPAPETALREEATPEPTTSDEPPPAPTASDTPAPTGMRPPMMGSSGNYTRVRGYNAWWANSSTSLLFAITPAEIAAFGEFGRLTQCFVGGSSGGGGGDGPSVPPPCAIRLSSTSLCADRVDDAGQDIFLVNGTTSFVEELEVLVNPWDAEPTWTRVLRVDGLSVSGSGGLGPSPVRHVVDQFGRPVDDGESSSTSGSPHEAFDIEPLPMLHVCLSTGTAVMPGCDEPCVNSFFTPLNADAPFVLSALVVVDLPPSPDHPRGDNQRMTALPRYAIYLIVTASVALFAGLAVLVAWSSRARPTSWEREALLEGSWRGRGAGISREQAKDGMLDGRYRILHRLGRGSFSVVYLVERDGRRFALKYVQCQDDVDRHEAMKECEVVRQLQGHPNVINLVDMFLSYKFDTNLTSSSSPSNVATAYPSSEAGLVYSDNFAFAKDGDGNDAVNGSGGGEGGGNVASQGERYLSLVMEYHEKGDLGRWVRQQRRSEQQQGRPLISEAMIVSIAYQISSVLNFMHNRPSPILHRDLKPENVLLSSTRYENVAASFIPVVVTDFGLSRVMDKTFCETGVGSLPYVAPEAWQRRYTTKVDVWALGCIVFAVATRRVEPDTVRVMFSECGRPDFHESIVSDIVTAGYSRGLGRFVAFLLHPDPEQRPSAADALRRIKKRFSSDLRGGGACGAMGASSSSSSSLLREQEDQSPRKGNLPNLRQDSQFEFYLAGSEGRELGDILPISPMSSTTTSLRLLAGSDSASRNRLLPRNTSATTARSAAAAAASGSGSGSGATAGQGSARTSAPIAGEEGNAMGTPRGSHNDSSSSSSNTTGALPPLDHEDPVLPPSCAAAASQRDSPTDKALPPPRSNDGSGAGTVEPESPEG